MIINWLKDSIVLSIDHDENVSTCYKRIAFDRDRLYPSSLLKVNSNILFCFQVSMKINGEKIQRVFEHFIYHDCLKENLKVNKPSLNQLCLLVHESLLTYFRYIYLWKSLWNGTAYFLHLIIPSSHSVSKSFCTHFNHIDHLLPLPLCANKLYINHIIGRVRVYFKLLASCPDVVLDLQL